MPYLEIGENLVNLDKLTVTSKELSEVLGVNLQQAYRLIVDTPTPPRPQGGAKRRRPGRKLVNVSAGYGPRADIAEVLDLVQERIAAGELSAAALTRLTRIVGEPVIDWSALDGEKRSGAY